MDAPLPILVGAIDQAAALAETMPDFALKLGALYWPGPLTMVLPRAPSFESRAIAGSDSIAVRVPGHAVPLGLIGAMGRPITGTSANRSGGAAPRTAADVIEQFGGEVDIVIDGGPAPLGVESTVVDLRGDVPRLLREGAISRQELELATGVRFEVTGR
jgi:L-threonylcarbamoyladenylate synthase